LPEIAQQPRDQASPFELPFVAHALLQTGSQITELSHRLRARLSLCQPSALKVFHAHVHVEQHLLTGVGGELSPRA
jgi:hypothetical protein